MLETLLNPLHGEAYQFWSGIGSDLGEVTLVIGLGAWWHHHTCTERRCWRKGHPDPETGHPACRKHSNRLGQETK